MAPRQSPSAPSRPTKKQRLDTLVEARGLANSRTQAQALIRAGKVFSAETRLDKPGHLVAADIGLAVRGPAHRWASRGGLKLVHGLDLFAIDPAGAIALDVGASTGGFTDVLLDRGAARVYAVDVGRGQLDWRLRQDPRVVVLERQNARYLDETHIPEPPAVITCDVSFIGLELALPAALGLARPDAYLIALIKPQFEVGRGEVGKGGIVRDDAARTAACERIAAWLDGVADWSVQGLTESPITGADGNREYLIAGRKA